MDHHLKHAISSNTRLIYNTTENAWEGVRKRVKIVLENKTLMEEWNKVFNYCYRKGVDSYGDDKALTSLHPVNNTMQLSRHSYLKKNFQNIYFYIDGMCSQTRGLIPSYTDQIPLGSVLAGIDGGSVEDSRKHFNNYKQYVLGQIGKTCNWFLKDVFEEYTKKENSDLSLKNEFLIEDIKNFLQANHFNAEIIKIPKDFVPYFEISKKMKNFLKENRMYIKSEEGSNLGYYKYNTKEDFNNNNLFKEIKKDLKSYIDYCFLEYDFDFAKKNEKKIDEIRNKNFKKSNKLSC